MVEALLDRNTFSCGTIRPNHRGLPGLKSDGEMGKGEMDFAQSGDISVSRWKDRGSKAVTVISSMHNAEIKKKVNRTQPDGKKKKSIAQNQSRITIAIWGAWTFLTCCCQHILFLGRVGVGD